MLGNPLPKPDDKFTWEKLPYHFDFELGLAPKFEIDLDVKNKITLYHIVADDAFIDEELLHIRKQYGKLISQEEVQEGCRLTGTFTYEYKGEKKEKEAIFDLDKIKGKGNLKKFLGKKPGDSLTLKTKNLFTDDHDLMHALGLDHDDAHGFDTEVSFTISELNLMELATLDQEFFDKIFGPEKVKDEAELREEIKKSAEKQFQNQADQQFLNAATDYLIAHTKFDLPAAFLKKWLQIGTGKELTEEEAIAEYERSEKGLRYQLIEEQIAKEHNLVIGFEELRKYTEEALIAQYAQYGLPKPSTKDLQPIVNNVLSDKEETQRLSEQLMSQKLLDFYKENLKNYKKKDVTYKEFVEETYK